ncbi:Ankyrin repeat and SOCS box protein 11 [Merluccius polli]|uniref:Ankyrin repeat and SOCS box protein 11 n=1 Tax=Merluccius polli TaxID=89951 RepID=A0AA47NCD2_MERPO|nr:Ankyrin repeat and SOCS box protein 11 [Merluccius polli]
MAETQTEALLDSQFWQRPLRAYGGLACNSFMADSWSDRTPLHDAAFQGRLLSLRTLLTQGFPADILSMDRVTPLHEACLAGHYACAKLLLDNGAMVEAVSSNGATPLFNACSSGSVACVRLILQRSPAIHSTLLASPIHAAAKIGQWESMELLLSYGAYIDLELPGLGTPLYCACLAGATQCVEGLLLSGADIRLGCGQESPFHAAVEAGAVGVAELLMDYGADGSCRNSQGKTPFDLAAPNSTMKVMLQNRGPCPLSQFCRLSIRRCLGRSRLPGASGLFLPHRLKDFLLYQ